MIKKLFSFLFIDSALKADIAFLKQIPLFAGLSDRQIAKIALLTFKKTYQPKEIIFKENQEAEVIYIVKSGQVQIAKESEEKILGENSFFGEISLIGSMKHKYRGISLDNSLLYLIYRIKLEDMFEADYKAGFKIMKNLLKCLNN